MPSNVTTSDFVGTRTIFTDVVIIIIIITCILLYSFLHQTVLMYLVVVMPYDLPTAVFSLRVCKHLAKRLKMKSSL